MGLAFADLAGGIGHLSRHRARLPAPSRPSPAACPRHPRRRPAPDDGRIGTDHRRIGRPSGQTAEAPRAVHRLEPRGPRLGYRHLVARCQPDPRRRTLAHGSLFSYGARNDEGASNLSGLDASVRLLLWVDLGRSVRLPGSWGTPRRSLVPHLAWDAPVGPSALRPVVILQPRDRRHDPTDGACPVAPPVAQSRPGPGSVAPASGCRGRDADGLSSLLSPHSTGRRHLSVDRIGALLHESLPHLEPGRPARFRRRRSPHDGPVFPFHHDFHRHGGRHQFLVDSPGDALRDPSPGRIHPHGLYWISPASGRRWAGLCLARVVVRPTGHEPQETDLLSGKSRSNHESPAGAAGIHPQLWNLGSRTGRVDDLELPAFFGLGPYRNRDQSGVAPDSPLSDDDKNDASDWDIPDRRTRHQRLAARHRTSLYPSILWKKRCSFTTPSAIASLPSLPYRTRQPITLPYSATAFCPTRTARAIGR